MRRYTWLVSVGLLGGPVFFTVPAANAQTAGEVCPPPGGGPVMTSCVIMSYLRGNVYLTGGSNDLAVAQYSNAIAGKPDFSLAYYGRGNAYEAEANDESAIADYSKALELQPDMAQTLNNRGNIYVKKGNDDKALADFDKAISLKPNLAPAYNGRGNVFSQTGNATAAIAEYGKAIALQPDLSEAYNGRGRAYLAIGNRPSAETDLAKAVALNPRSSATSMLLSLRQATDSSQSGTTLSAATASTSGRPDLAVTDAAKRCDELAASPVDNTRPKGVPGVPFDQIDGSASVDLCRTALAFDPKSGRLAFQLGRALQRAGQFHESVKMYTQGAANGDPLGFVNAGLMFRKGTGIEVNKDMAVQLYMEAANQGVTGAMVELGDMQFHGDGVRQDQASAALWYKKAAEANDLDGMANYGLILDEGWGVPLDHAAGVAWMRKAAAAGSAKAASDLQTGSSDSSDTPAYSGSDYSSPPTSLEDDPWYKAMQENQEEDDQQAQRNREWQEDLDRQRDEQRQQDDNARYIQQQNGDD
jgi:lipoprotein NlpI